MPINTEKLPYYKINRAIHKWALCGGADGCEILNEAELGSDKPPPMPEMPKALPAASKPETKPDTAVKMLVDLQKAAKVCSRFKTWLDTPDPPKPPEPAPVQQQKTDTVPPFDIQEIPAAMRKHNMPMGAKLMERWFAGELNYSPDDDAESAGLNQDGKPYPPSMIDKTDITMKWALGFQRAKVQYDDLVRRVIYTAPSVLQLHKMLKRYPDGTEVDAEKLYGGNMVLIHQHLQFEMAPVEGSFEQKAAQALNRAIEDRGVPDDLTAALGSFVIYAAIERASIRNGVATVSAISIYIKDNYTFGTEPGHVSQYLGHWSSKGVIIVPLTEGATIANSKWASFSVKLGDPRVKGNAYRPVRNSNFRQWQKTHGRGGDFFIYSDKIVRNLLAYPIVVPL